MSKSNRKGGIQPGKFCDPKGETDKLQAEDTLAEQLEALALSHAVEALNVLAEIAFSEDADPTARVAAASAILDLGWGKPGTALEVSGEAIPASDNTLGEDEEPTRH